MYAFGCKIQQRALSSGESTAGVTYLSMGILPNSCCISPLKVVQHYLVVQGRAQLELSSHIVKVSIKVTC